ncbi:MAG TPA: class I SAM-dependent methyltransferase [Holophagaceae bacterium]|nr:class I SAM-dependent methyltransferase [Holophagaceae bacterium]
MAEQWRRIYAEAPEVFAAFARAEDPDGRVSAALLRQGALEGRRVLEIGAGTGKLAGRLSPACAAWIGLEPEAALLARMAPGPMGLRALGQQLPLKDRSVDRAVAAWVLGYLGRSTVGAILADVGRVLAPGAGAGIWAIENAGSGDFQTLRGFRGLEPGARRLVDEFGFRVVEEVPLRLTFDSPGEAARILGALCGEEVRQALDLNPRKELSHAAALLFRPF